MTIYLSHWDLVIEQFRHSHQSSIIEPPKKMGDLGCDITVPTTVVGKRILPFSKIVIDTQLSVRVRDSQGRMFGLIVEPRSSKWLKALLPKGVIDATYTGTIKLVIRNLSPLPYRVRHGDKLCQLIPFPAYNITTELVTTEFTGERGDNGFGSTG